MPFEELVLYMLRSKKGSTQSALRDFFKSLGKTVFIRQQSFAEARTKIKYEAFIEMFKITAYELLAACRESWHGYRVCAVDGSKITLPDDKELAEYFGTTGKGATSPTAQGSILYDVLNDIVIDAQIEPLTCDERTLAFLHINSCMEDMEPDGKYLIIYDRGYPSYELIRKHENEGLKYVMRVRNGFNNAIDSQTAADGYVWLSKNNERLHVRVLKFQLDSGETETLITNITDKRLGVKAFKKMYFLRWPVETKYDVVKNKLQLENFSSLTIDNIKQDFYATMFLTNTVAAAVHDAQPKVDEVRKDKNNTYDYRVNINETIGVLKDRFVEALVLDDPIQQDACIQDIINEVQLYVVPFRPDRSIPRTIPRKANFHHNQKANC